MEKPKFTQFRVSEALKERVRALPTSMSKSVRKAIKAAEQQPELLAQAFRYRLYSNENEDDQATTLSLYIDHDLHDSLRQLAKSTRLSEQDVARLCFEAHVYKL